MQQMGFAQAAAAIEKERVVAGARSVGHRQVRSQRELRAGPIDKGFKGVVVVQLRLHRQSACHGVRRLAIVLDGLRGLLA
jgi:hypothetical protein